MGNGRPPKEQAALRRMFGDLPVVEATEPLIVVPNGVDRRWATPGDENNCALARACRRMYNVHKAVFLRTRAYVEIPNEDGRHVVRRYILPTVTRRAIQTFDIEGVMPPGGFRLRPPTASETLEGMRAGDKRQRARRGGHAAPSTGKKTGRAEDVLGLEGLRSGTGQRYFSTERPGAAT